MEHNGAAWPKACVRTCFLDLISICLIQGKEWIVQNPVNVKDMSTFLIHMPSSVLKTLNPSIATASVWSLVPYSWTPLITNSAPQPEGGPVSWHLNTILLLMQGTNHKCASASINKNSGDMSRLPKRLSGILECYCWSLLYTHDCAAHESCSSMLSDSKAFFFFIQVLAECFLHSQTSYIHR